MPALVPYVPDTAADATCIDDLLFVVPLGAARVADRAQRSDPWAHRTLQAWLQWGVAVAMMVPDRRLL